MKTTEPRCFVLVLMPSRSEFDDVYRLGIKPACTDSGAICERVDVKIFDGNILQRIYKQIAKADIVVSDITDQNPNVFYETSYAHVLGKRVILLTKQAENVPFDLKHYSHIVYQGHITVLKTELEKRIRWCIDNPDAETQPASHHLELFVEGLPLEGNPKVKIQERKLSDDLYKMGLNILVHNRSSTVIDGSKIEVELLGPSGFRGCSSHRATLLPEGQCLVAMGAIGFMPPDFWKPLRMTFMTHEIGQELIPTSIGLECMLKVVTEFGVQELTFVLHLIKAKRASQLWLPLGLVPAAQQPICWILQPGNI